LQTGEEHTHTHGVDKIDIKKLFADGRKTHVPYHRNWKQKIKRTRNKKNRKVV